MSRNNPETSYCEIRKAISDSNGIGKILAIVDVVQGEDKAASAVERFERHMTAKEKLDRVTFYWAYTSRSAWQSWRQRNRAKR